MPQEEKGTILKTTANAVGTVLNKKLGVNTGFAPSSWANTINLLGLLPIKTATKSAICSFSDGADSVPCPSVLCEINPLQASGTPSPSNPLAISGFTGLTLYKSADAPVSGVYTIEPVQSGSGTPSPSNPRPISAGLTFTMDDSSTMSVYGGTLDVFSGTLTITWILEDLGNVNWSGFSGAKAGLTSSASVFPTQPNAYGGTNDAMCNAVCTQYDSSSVLNTYTNLSNNTITFSSSNTCYIFNSDFSGMSNAEIKTALTGVKVAYKIATPVTYQLTATELERAMTALGITTLSVNWQSEAGTVYGGTLDVVSGVLTVTHERIDMGQMSWTKASNYNVMYANLGGVNTEYNAYCEIYLYSGTVTSAGGAYNKGNNTLSILTNDSRYLIYVRDDNYTDATTFTNSVNGHYLVYELATPVTYQLTPQEVNSLLATNNFFHDANGDTQVQYRSTSAVVDSKTITANGTYNASADNLDGYSSVSVNVAPNVGTKNITQNGTYTASSESLDGYSEVTVNVSGGEIFSNKYTFTNTPATINKCIIDYAHNSDSLWAHSGSSYAICADSNGNIYYDTTLNAIVRTGSGYYAEITSLGIVASQFRTQDTASMSWTSETWTNSTSSVNVADLSKYIIANTFDILDENGNVVLPANCSLSDLGLA